jgi:hypothetical protein
MIARFADGGPTFKTEDLVAQAVKNIQSGAFQDLEDINRAAEQLRKAGNVITDEQVQAAYSAGKRAQDEAIASFIASTTSNPMDRTNPRGSSAAEALDLMKTAYPGITQGEIAASDPYKALSAASQYALFHTGLGGEGAPGAMAGGIGGMDVNIRARLEDAARQAQAGTLTKAQVEDFISSNIGQGKDFSEQDLIRATGKTSAQLLAEMQFKQPVVTKPPVVILPPTKPLPDLTEEFVAPTAPPPQAPPVALTAGQEGLDPSTAIVGKIPESERVKIPQLDTEFRASEPRTATYDRFGRITGYNYSPAAKLTPATGTNVFNWTPPGITSRPRSLLNLGDVPGVMVDPVTGQMRLPLSASQQFARDRSTLDNQFRQLYARAAAGDKSLPTQAPTSAAAAFRNFVMSGEDPMLQNKLRFRDIEQQKYDPTKADPALRAQYGQSAFVSDLAAAFDPFLARNRAALTSLAEQQTPKSYSEQYPDIAEAYAKLSEADKAKFPTLRDYELYHFDTYGSKEGRTSPLLGMGALQSPYATAFFSKGGEASTEDFIKKQSGGDVSRETASPNTAEVPKLDTEGRLIDEREEIRSESQRMLNRLQSQPSKLPPGLRRTIAATKEQGKESMFPAAAPARDLLSGILGASPTAPGSEAYRTGQAIANMPPVQAAAAIPAKIAASAGDAATALAAMGPAVGAVIKPKGGNWIRNQPGNYLRTLKNTPDVDQDIVMAQERLADLENTPSPFNTEPMRRELKQELAGYETEKSLNNWIDTKLGKYVKNEMGTPEDPLRKLAERGVLHIDPAHDWDTYLLTYRRRDEGFPEKGIAQGELAKRWENIVDYDIEIEKQKHFVKNADEFNFPSARRFIAGNPWVKNLDPETSLYSILPLAGEDRLGFVHLIDELRNASNPQSGLPQNLQVDPRKLDRISVPQAVELVDKINKWRVENVKNLQLEETLKADLYKAYPEQNYRWVQLNRPGQFAAESDAMGHSVRGYEPPDKGGSDYYGLGGFKAIESGEAKVYSLRDEKGQPHVTIEVGQGSRLPRHQEILDEMERSGLNPRSMGQDEYNTAYREAQRTLEDRQPLRITQIKGKGNAMPAEKYMPFIQDFVKSGNWTEVNDLQNTGLIRLGNEYLTSKEIKPLVEQSMRYLEQSPALEPHRQARRALNDYWNTSSSVHSSRYRELENQAGMQVHPDIPYTYGEMLSIFQDPGSYDPSSLRENLERVNRLRQLYGEEGFKKGGPVDVPRETSTSKQQLDKLAQVSQRKKA